MNKNDDNATKTMCAAMVVEWIAAQGIETLFELSGGMITPIIDAAYAHPSMRILEMRHEQSAAYAAAGQAVYTGRPSVALGTAGPGALNLISGIAQAWYDSLPVLFIVGQVPTHMQSGDRAVRQWGIQEAAFLELVRPIAKYVATATCATEVIPALEAAIQVATTGRPGPVVVEIPFNVQYQKITPPVVSTLALTQRSPPTEAAVRQFLAAVKEAKRPLILAGGGIHTAQAGAAFRAFVDQTGLPVVATLRGLDLMPSAHPQMIGMVGIQGVRRANLALAKSDCLLVLGSRLDNAVTAGNTHWFGTNRRIMQVDNDPNELGVRITESEILNADLSAFLAMSHFWPVLNPLVLSQWKMELANVLQDAPVDEPCAVAEGSIEPKAFIRALSHNSADATACVLDAGNFTWWSCHSFRLAEGQRVIAGGGLLAMGFGLPAALGVAFETRAPVLLICGDGGLQCSIQELETIRQAKLPIKIVVINNESHGAVRQFQDLLFEGRHCGTVKGYSAPDFTAVARAYRITAQRIVREEEVVDGIDALWRDPGSPMLLEVMIDPSANATPEVPMGGPLNRMRPPRPAT